MTIHLKRRYGRTYPRCCKKLVPKNNVKDTTQSKVQGFFFKCVFHWKLARLVDKSSLVGGFIFFIFPTTWGNDPVGLVCFFKWVETGNHQLVLVVPGALFTQSVRRLRVFRRSQYNFLQHCPMVKNTWQAEQPNSGYLGEVSSYELCFFHPLKICLIIHPSLILNELTAEPVIGLLIPCKTTFRNH